MRLIALTVLLMLCPAICHAEGLGTLIEAGTNMAEIAKEQNTQTLRYEQVKRAVESGALVKGAARDTVIASYGEPVIQNTDTATGRIKIVYMPATSDFFKGAKVYLYFADGVLDEILVKQ
jgi:hypothetical protein